MQVDSYSIAESGFLDLLDESGGRMRLRRERHGWMLSESSDAIQLVRSDFAFV